MLLAVALVALLQTPVAAEQMQALSFQPPFDKVDSDGRRIVNDTWSYGGSTDVKKTFIRLTTDRQSKRGFVWQRTPLGRETFSAILTFRISGVGKRWFGDGIGLWFTNHRSFVQGPNHGFTDKFTGVGIVLDTFNNPEHKGGHKDLSIQINDGTKNINMMNDETRIGCDAAVRYHENNAGFDPVHSMSRLKVKIDGKRLVLEVDASANGRWVACQEVTLPFAADWLRTATIGITGATGALADNHDVIRFDAFEDFDDVQVSTVDAQTIVHTVSKDYKKWLDSPNCGTDCLIAVLQKELANFRVEAEHRFSDLKEKTENNVMKLKKQEKENERRVAEIEDKIGKRIDQTLDETNQNLDTVMTEKIARQLAENPELKSGGGWKTPFALLVLGLGVGGFFVYRKYQAIMKHSSEQATHSIDRSVSSWTTMRSLLLLCASLCAWGCATAKPMPSFSFSEPYDKVDAAGKREISPDFEYGGSTDVKKNFIRLTTDRQSKRGYVWSKNAINNDQMVAVVSFRIHGQGRRWFGDGIGIWLTHEKRHQNGENHGFLEKYYGVGILLDTFKNVEHRGGHKDVTLQINDGTKTVDDFNDQQKIGCDGDFRYHSGSAAFDPVYSSSRLRIKVNGNNLELEIDPRNEGRWTSCYSGDLPFSREWLRQASFGITASTGSLADNHDIIKVATFDDVNDYGVNQADAEVWTHNYSKDYDKLLDSSVCDQNCKVAILQKMIANFHVETEHWFEELKEQTQNTVNKLREKEAVNQQKIQALTDRMTAMMDNKIGAKVADMYTSVQEKIATNVEGEMVVAQSSWRMPFFVLVLLLAAAFAFAYQKYQKLVKSHLL
ncbi:TPA: hypothetical protein N0F65_001078 [Lagenidium giganteum]|uniref:L-type lectin-like domain-containing protein n=1 Tax=Lagenidium giganteum TaxID=4803 RepID=A0AAV2YLS1_9STRA|nr:TPA: hypothetical protein N0F65_001078 [Lagenidium giganteum]